MKDRVEIESMMATYAGLFGVFRRAWDSVRVRAKRNKCIVSGCEIPARGIVGRRIVDPAWPTCGVHRKPVAELLNKATSEYADAVNSARRKRVVTLLNGLDDLGCHEDEIALAG